MASLETSTLKKAGRDDDVVRIIGARWSNQRERALYHTYMDENR